MQVFLFWEKEQLVLADWLKSLPKPLGLMTCSDDRARSVIEASKITGLNVPEDVAIIGVDNDELVCSLANPPLSSVAMNVERAGYEIAEVLDKLMAGEKMAGQRIIVHPTHIVTRQSTDILATEDREVASAVHFIHQNGNQIIQVADVIDATTLSRRALEQRFRKILGRSILEEIRRVRVERVSRMLMETNLSVSQIAKAIGYSNSENITRYFRREKGISPLTYRKKYGQK